MKTAVYFLSAFLVVCILLLGAKEKNRRVELTRQLSVIETAEAVPNVVIPARFSPSSQPIYNFSVIPGGAHTLEAFCADTKLDAAFVGFDCAKGRAFPLPADGHFYMTFRKFGLVRWTKKPVFVKAGEIMYTDGTRIFLARCGNQIRYTPQEPSMEIETSELERPVNRIPALPPVSYAPPTEHHVAIGGGGGMPSTPAPVESSSSKWWGAVVAVPMVFSHSSRDPGTPNGKCDPIETHCD